MLTSAAGDRYSISRNSPVFVFEFCRGMRWSARLAPKFSLQRLLRLSVFQIPRPLRSTFPNDSPDDVLGPGLGLLVDAAHVLSNNPQEKKHDPGQKGDGNQQRCKPLW